MADVMIKVRGFASVELLKAVGLDPAPLLIESATKEADRIVKMELPNKIFTGLSDGYAIIELTCSSRSLAGPPYRWIVEQAWLSLPNELAANTLNNVDHAGIQIFVPGDPNEYSQRAHGDKVIVKLSKSDAEEVKSQHRRSYSNGDVFQEELSQVTDSLTTVLVDQHVEEADGVEGEEVEVYFPGLSETARRLNRSTAAVALASVREWQKKVNWRF